MKNITKNNNHSNLLTFQSQNFKILQIKTIHKSKAWSAVNHNSISFHRIQDKIIITGTVNNTVATEAQKLIFITVCISSLLAAFIAVINSGLAAITAITKAQSHIGKW